MAKPPVMAPINPEMIKQSLLKKIKAKQQDPDINWLNDKGYAGEVMELVVELITDAVAEIKNQNIFVGTATPAGKVEGKIE